MEGVVNFDKSAGVSSARAVGSVKRLLQRGTKIGHAGTLDPFATGVLLLLVGKATKACERLMDQPKQYEATLKLGATTATLDPESPEEPWPLSPGEDRLAVPLLAQIRQVLPRFIGEVCQRPPTFSAMKVKGRRAYDLARKGQDVVLASRPVRVYGIELLEYSWPLLRLRIDCGRGTYVRSIARDLGEALVVGGYLTQLRRTRIGVFDVKDAVDLPALTRDGVAAHVQIVPVA